MLQVLNAKERNEMFLKFLILFLITVSILIFSLYFNFISVPTKEIVDLRRQVQSYESLETEKRKLILAIDLSLALIDSLNDNLNTDFTSHQISDKLWEMQNDVKSNLFCGDLNQSIVNALSKYKGLKEQMLSLKKDGQKQVEELTNKLNNCAASLQVSQQNLNIHRQQSSAGAN